MVETRLVPPGFTVWLKRRAARGRARLLLQPACRGRTDGRRVNNKAESPPAATLKVPHFMNPHPESGQKDASIWRAGQDDERGSGILCRQAFTRRKTGDGVGGSRENAARRKGFGLPFTTFSHGGAPDLLALVLAGEGC